MKSRETDGKTFYQNIPKMSFRTIDDIQVLEHCEISPTRTTFVEELGEGAFGKVHKAILENGLEFFKSQQDCSKRKREQFVAVKELHGEYKRFPYAYNRAAYKTHPLFFFFLHLLSNIFMLLSVLSFTYF